MRGRSLAIWRIAKRPGTGVLPNNPVGGRISSDPTRAWVKIEGKQARGKPLQDTEGRATVAAAVDVSVIVPTYRERACLERLDAPLLAALRPFPHEIVVVDDSSPDGTGDWVLERERSGAPYRLLSRPQKSGLASAVIDGLRASRGDCLVVMDGDGSHPPELIPELVAPIRGGRAEFVLASRHRPGGSDPGLVGVRRTVSWGATLLSRPLTRVTDPMSGFFALDRRILARGQLAPIGYKIGLEILVKCRPSPVAEVPLVFRPRIAGESKLGAHEFVLYLRHLERLYAWRAHAYGRRPGAASSAPPTP